MSKMNTGKQDWDTLYTNNLESIWKQERPELKKTAMLVYALSIELSNVKNMAEKELNDYRECYAKIDKCKARRILLPVDDNVSEDPAKLNKQHFSPLIGSINTSKSYLSPDIFHCDSPEYFTPLTSTNKVQEEMNADGGVNTSPKISRCKRLLKRKGSNEESEAATTKLTCTSTADVIYISSQDDIIEGTPLLATNKVNNVPAKTRQKSKHKGKCKIQNQTLTQMYKLVEDFIIPLTGNEINSKQQLEDIHDKTTQQNKQKLEFHDKTTQQQNVKNPDKTTQQQKVNDPDKTIQSQNKQELDDDIDPTCIEITQRQRKIEICQAYNNNMKENKKCGDFKQFVAEYDRVPEKLCKAAMEVKSPDKRKIKNKKTEAEQDYNRTFSGFWDVNFSVRDPDDESDDSNIF